jgi:hypothetical protein
VSPTNHQPDTHDNHQVHQVHPTSETSDRSAPQRLEEGRDLDRLAKALANAKTDAAQAKAMVAMRSAGAS